MVQCLWSETANNIINNINHILSSGDFPSILRYKLNDPWRCLEAEHIFRCSPVGCQMQFKMLVISCEALHGTEPGSLRDSPSSVAFATLYNGSVNVFWAPVLRQHYLMGSRNKILLQYLLS